MKSYIIARQFTVWEEAEIFADSEDEAVALAENKWPELSPVTIHHYEPTGKIHITLPSD